MSKWKPHKPLRRVSARKYRGLGDVVAAVAEPLARGIDELAGTKIKECAGCKRRRRKLNEWVPFEGRD